MEVARCLTQLKTSGVYEKDFIEKKENKNTIACNFAPSYLRLSSLLSITNFLSPIDGCFKSFCDSFFYFFFFFSFLFIILISLQQMEATPHAAICFMGCRRIWTGMRVCVYGSVIISPRPLEHWPLRVCMCAVRAHRTIC